VFTIGLAADPRKTADWEKQMKARVGEQAFAQEYGLQWGISSNMPFFPEYQIRGGDETFVRKINGVGKGPLLVGLDFGQMKPAIVLAQTNLRATQLFLLREWLPMGIPGPAFAEVCGWLCGWYPLNRVSAAGLQHVHRLQRQAAAGEIPAVPWLPEGHNRDSHRYAGHEALRQAGEVASESNERCNADIWAAKGMPLSVGSYLVVDSAGAIRHLLRQPPPNAALPYLVIDESCTIIRRALNGGYTYARATKANPNPIKPFKDGLYDNMMDAVRYLAAAVIDMRKADNGQADEDVIERVVAREERTSRVLHSRDGAGREEPGSVGFSTAMGRESSPLYGRGGR
jgi:hypothetical protein